jgi:hypothetical protein
LEQTSIIDLGVTLTVARAAKVILFATEQALALKPALDRFAEDVTEYRLPFPSVMLQFSEPSPQAALLTSVEQTDDMRFMGVNDDTVVALLLGQGEEDGSGKIVNSVTGYRIQ